MSRPTITVARTLDEVEQLRPAWEALQGDTPRTDPDYYLTVLRTSPEQMLRPHLVLAEEAGEPRAMIVGRLESIRAPARLGYKTVANPRVRSLTVSPGGLLGSASLAEALYDELWSILEAGEADVLTLPSLRVGSELYELARSRPPQLSRPTSSAPFVHRRLVLPESFDAFLRTKSSKSRGHIKRYPKRFLTEFDGRWRIRTYRDASEIDELFAAVVPVASKTYHHRLGAAFADTPRQRAVMQLAAERGWLRCDVLEVDGVPRGFWTGMAYRGTFHTGHTGYDPQFTEYNLGTFILIRLLEDLFADPHMRILDHGQGDAQYKHTFGNDEWREENLMVYAPSLRARRIAATHRAAAAGSSLARRAAARVGGAQKVKTRWRRRLAEKRPSGAQA